MAIYSAFFKDKFDFWLHAFPYFPVWESIK